MAKTPVRIILLKGNPDFDESLEIPTALHFKEFTSGNARLYWKITPDQAPKWVKNIFSEEQDLQMRLTTHSIAAVLLIKHSGKVFGITFGHGKSLMKQELIEPRFGLKVVLNRVNPESLRSIDTKSLDGFLSQTREQVPSLSPMSNFGIDIEKDFIKAVTGLSKDDVIGKTITGTDSYYASIDVNLSDITSILDRLITAFEDTAYKDNFEFVDNIAEVPKALSEQLDKQLVANIVSDSVDRIWLAPPDIMDWENHGGFNFKSNGTTYDDIGLDDYLSEKMRDRSRLNIRKLRDHKIIQMTAEQLPATKWPVYKCLYAEIEDAGKRFILSDGKWFEVDRNYMDRIQQYLDGHLNEWEGASFPDYESARMLEPGDEGLKGEALYNYELAVAQSLTLMDAKTITHGGANSKIELCDLYGPNLYIHIKRYTRSSGLSHLFNQGKVSAELICSDPEFREKAAAKITSQGGTAGITVSRPDMNQIQVVFGVVSAAQGGLRLPFFSQVALKNAVYFLKNTLNVGKVSLVKIQAVD